MLQSRFNPDTGRYEQLVPYVPPPADGKERFFLDEVGRLLGVSATAVQRGAKQAGVPVEEGRVRVGRLWRTKLWVTASGLEKLVVFFREREGKRVQRGATSQKNRWIR